jgi:hypothetical protein
VCGRARAGSRQLWWWGRLASAGLHTHRGDGSRYGHGGQVWERDAEVDAAERLHRYRLAVLQCNRWQHRLAELCVARTLSGHRSGVNSLGQTILLAPIDLGTSGSNPQNYDLSHAHAAFVAMYDGGRMDGANLIPCSPAASCPPNAHPNPQFMYVKPADVQPYFALAEQYTFGDRMFQTNEGPSFPAHQFIIAGTSAPTATSPLFAAQNPALSPAGCIAAALNTVTMIDAAGSETAQPAQYPCFDHPTVTDLLGAAQGASNGGG